MLVRAEPGLGGGQVGSPAVGVRRRSQPAGGNALAEDLASVEGVRPAPAGADPVGLRLAGGVAAPEIARVLQTDENQVRRVIAEFNTNGDGFAAPSYRGRASEEDR